MKKSKVGIIGCGTIGSALAKRLSRDFKERAALVFLCDHRPEKAVRLQKELRRRPSRQAVQIVSMKRLIQNSDLIIEAASASVSGRVAKESLRRNKNVLIMSVGGLLGAMTSFSLLKRSQGKLWIPSGALAGVDALLAANEGRIKSVKLVTQKPAAALREAPYFRIRKFPALRGLKPHRIFSGSAREAVKSFPQNINVAAVLSLAGIGPAKTRVEIWTSRAMRCNQHKVTIEGDFGKIETLTQNIPSPENPKTSYLAVLSAAATLKKIFSSFQIGT